MGPRLLVYDARNSRLQYTKAFAKFGLAGGAIAIRFSDFKNVIGAKFVVPLLFAARRMGFPAANPVSMAHVFGSRHPFKIGFRVVVRVAIQMICFVTSSWGRAMESLQNEPVDIRSVARIATQYDLEVFPICPARLRLEDMAYAGAT